MAEEKQGKLVAIELPIKFYGAEDVVAIFADVAAVTHATGIFVISFYQAHAPMFLSEEQGAHEPKEVPARCVSRVVLTPKLFKGLLAAMQGNLEKYNRLAELKQKEAKEEYE